MAAPPVEQGTVALTLTTSREALRAGLSVISELVRGLGSPEELLRFQLAVQEILTNAFEHGNLGITASEKALLCEQGLLEAEQDKRTPGAFTKRIRVKASLAESLFELTVGDDGSGFDWAHTLSKVPSSEDLTNLSGRGISIIRAMFDSVEYNPTGTEITVKKSFRRR